MAGPCKGAALGAGDAAGSSPYLSVAYCRHGIVWASLIPFSKLSPAACLSGSGGHGGWGHSCHSVVGPGDRRVASCSWYLRPGLTAPRPGVGPGQATPVGPPTYDPVAAWAVRRTFTLGTPTVEAKPDPGSHLVQTPKTASARARADDLRPGRWFCGFLGCRAARRQCGPPGGGETGQRTAVCRREPSRMGQSCGRARAGCRLSR